MVCEHWKWGVTWMTQDCEIKQSFSVVQQNCVCSVEFLTCWCLSAFDWNYFSLKIRVCHSGNIENEWSKQGKTQKFGTTPMSIHQNIQNDLFKQILSSNHLSAMEWNGSKTPIKMCTDAWKWRTKMPCVFAIIRIFQDMRSNKLNVSPSFPAHGWSLQHCHDQTKSIEFGTNTQNKEHKHATLQFCGIVQQSFWKRDRKLKGTQEAEHCCFSVCWCFSVSHMGMICNDVPHQWSMHAFLPIIWSFWWQCSPQSSHNNQRERASLMPQPQLWLNFCLSYFHTQKHYLILKTAKKLKSHKTLPLTVQRRIVSVSGFASFWVTEKHKSNQILSHVCIFLLWHALNLFHYSLLSNTECINCSVLFEQWVWQLPLLALSCRCNHRVLLNWLPWNLSTHINHEGKVVAHQVLGETFFPLHGDLWWAFASQKWNTRVQGTAQMRVEDCC